MFHFLITELLMKKNFEVIVSPGDILGNEMQDILGGTGNTLVGCTKCKKTECNCKGKDQIVIGDKELAGYNSINGIYVEID